MKGESKARGKLRVVSGSAAKPLKREKKPREPKKIQCSDHPQYERYRLLALAARNAFGDWDIEKDRMWCSEGMRAALGLDEIVENAYAWWVQCMHPDDRDRMTSHLDQILQSNQITDETEFRVRTASGDYIHILFRIYIQRDSKGKAKRMLGLAADITHRKIREENWRLREERYRAIIESIEDGYHESDLDGKFTFFNDACARNLGRSREEMTGMSAWEIMPDKETLRNVRAQYGKVLRTGIPVQRFEHDFLRKDGERRALESSISLIRDSRGRPVGFRGTSREATDRKRDEDALRRYAAEISDLYNNAPCGYHSLGPDGTFLKINNTELSWLGYTSEEIVGKKKWSDLLTPTGVRTYEETFPVLKQRGWIDNVELELIRKDGTLLPILLNATAIKDAEGRFVMSRSTLFDMTERRRIEGELRESEQLYRTAMEASNDGISIANHGVYVYANQKFGDLLGWPCEEIVGKPAGYFTHPEDLERVLEFIKLRSQGKFVPNPQEIRCLKKDGTTIYLEISTNPVVYKGENCQMTYLRDITVRKKAERTLRESEEKYRSIIENIEDNYFESDLAGNIAFVNPSMSRTLGRSREEIIGLNYRAYTPPEDAKRIYDKFNEMFRTGKPATIADHVIIRKDGSRRYIEVSSSVIRGVSGKPIGARGIGRDITERMRLEEESKRLTARLNQAQKMQAIGTLAGGIAHDFNNILASIMGFTEMAKLQLMQPELDDYLEQILKSCGRAKDLVNQILTFGQKREKEVKPVDLNPLIEEISRLLRATLPATIEIQTELGLKSHTVLADTTEIHQIVMNLSTNAAHAMRERGGILKISLGEFEVDAGNKEAHPDLEPGRYVELSVLDTGEGIDQDTIGQIFDPFFTTKERGKGTGLGLSVVYGISKEYGGTVSVKSQPAEGSVFSVFLPAVEGGVDVAVEKPKSIPRGTERVLFVDDEETIAAIGKEMLEYLGYTVVSTDSSIKALDIFRAEPERFDLVITDLTMPALTGAALAEELLKIRSDVPIILSTGYSDLITEEEARQIGVREFFMKPFSLEQMAQGIRKALNKI